MDDPDDETAPRAPPADVRRMLARIAKCGGQLRSREREFLARVARCGTPTAAQVAYLRAIDDRLHMARRSGLPKRRERLRGAAE